MEMITLRVDFIIMMNKFKITLERVILFIRFLNFYLTKEQKTHSFDSACSYTNKLKKKTKENHSFPKTQP